MQTGKFITEVINQGFTWMLSNEPVKSSQSFLLHTFWKTLTRGEQLNWWGEVLKWWLLSRIMTHSAFPVRKITPKSWTCLAHSSLFRGPVSLRVSRSTKLIGWSRKERKVLCLLKMDAHLAPCHNPKHRVFCAFFSNLLFSQPPPPQPCTCFRHTSFPEVFLSIRIKHCLWTNVPPF